MLKRIITGMVLFAAFLMVITVKAQPLPPDQAFQVSVSVDKNKNQVLTMWSVAPGYHLYADRLKFDFSPTLLFSPTLPTKTAQGFYENTFEIPIKVSPLNAGSFSLMIHYQGCASEGFCYPPTVKVFNVNLLAGKTTNTKTSFSRLLTNQYSIQSVLSHQTLFVLLAIFFGLGFLLALTPCVLPMIPILAGIIIGQRENGNQWRAFTLSFLYVLGMSSAYAVAGMIAALAGESLQVLVQQPVFIIAGSFIFLMLALSLFEVYAFPQPKRWHQQVHRWSRHHEGGTYLGVFLMGLVATLIVSPCVTAPLVGVLMYVGQTGNVLLGTAALFVLGLGMGVPLILAGTFAGRWMPKSGPWMEAVTKFFGLMMLAMSIWLLTRLLSPKTELVLWSLYFIFCVAYFVCCFPSRQSKKSVFMRLGFLVILLVILLTMMNGLKEVSHFIDRTLGLNYSETGMKTAKIFQFVNSTTELDAALAKAKQAGKPVMLDFYAEWCESCIEMDREIFSQSAMLAVLNQFVLLRVDMTDNTEGVQAIMKRYHVIAPPTLLFFDREGHEVTSRRIVGSITIQEFLERMRLFKFAKCDVSYHC